MDSCGHAYRIWKTKFPHSLLQDVQKKCNRKDIDPSWTVEEASFEKMGAMMADNDGKIIDELSAF